jgi:hypothetical protein
MGVTGFLFYYDRFAYCSLRIMSVGQTLHGIMRGYKCFMCRGQIMYNLEAWAGK